MAVNRYVAMGLETDYGTASTNCTSLRITGMSDPVNRSPAFEEACDISVATAAVAGAYKVSGTIDATLRFESFKPLFHSLLGGTTAEYTFSLTDTPKPYTILIGDDQSQTTTQYTGCGISSMELNMSVGQFVTAKMSWIGSKATVITAASHDVPDLSTDYPACWYNGVVKIGGTAIKMKSFNVKIDRKFDHDYVYIGSPLLQGLYMNGQSELGGSITLGSGEWSSICAVMTGTTNGSTITTPAVGSISAVGTDSLNQLYSGAMTVELSRDNGTKIGTLTLGTCIFTESNRSVQGRNQFDKTVTYRCVVPTGAAFSIAKG